MKKRNAFNLLLVLLLLLVSQTSFSQDGKDYSVKKANFYKKYLQYKEDLKTNPNAVKPVDPAGLFAINGNGQFTSIGSPIQADIQSQETMNQGPWINPPQTNTAAAYTWSQTTTTYTPITGGTTLGGVSNDDDNFNSINIGFNFIYDGVTYSQIGINANGYIRFGALGTSHYPYINSLNTLVFAGFNNDLRANNTTSNLQYLTTGTAGSRVMTIQWSNYGLYNSGYDGSDFSFQMKLYENTNTLQVVFGPNPTVLNVPGYLMQCGINTILTDFNNRTTTTDWTATTAGGTNTAASTFTAAIKPPSGQVWTWTPIPMTYTSSNTVQINSGVSVHQNTTNNPIIQIPVVTGGGSGALIATAFNVGTNGSTNPATDITNAKIYYTGLSNTFSTTALFGTQVSPSGTFTINGTQGLQVGTNYFWLTYDVPVTATIGNVLDAQCNSFTIGSTQIPSTTAPAGNRPISAVLTSFCGTINVPGDYANLSDLFTDLNTVGVSCPTIVNIAAGYTETNVNYTLTCPISPPNATNTLTFRKNGAGANPLLTAGVGTSLTTDGIIKLNGVKYVTFDGIDLQENVANVDATTQMEWGYALVKQSGTLACQNITIKNCTVTLNKNNVNSTGIYTGNHTATSTTALTVTSLNGTGSYNKFYNNTVQNCFIGIQIQGFSAASPFDLFDQGNEIGTISGGRSQVLNFGNGTSATSAYGIRTISQNGLKIFNTNINSTGGVNNNSTLNGIFLSTATNGSCEIYGDTVTVVSGATTSQLMGINCDMGATGNGNTVSIHDNVVKDCLYPASTSGEFRGISINTNSTPSYLNLYNNKVLNNTIPGTGVFHCIGITGSSTNTLVGNVYNNTVSTNVKTGTSGLMYMFFMSTSIQQLNFYNNQASGNSASSSSSNMYGYYNFGVGYLESIHDNQFTNNTSGTGEFIAIAAQSGSGPTNKAIYNNTINGHTGTGIVGGIMVNFGTDIAIYKNNIYNLTSNNTTNASAVVYGIRDSTSTNATNTIYNNFVSELKAPSSISLQAVYGLYLAGPSTANNFYVYYNTVYLNAVSSSATTFGTVGLAWTNVTAAANLDLRNNVIVNNSTPGPTGGSTVAFQRRTTTLTNYNLVSGNNCFYAGTPAANRLIHSDGTNSDQTLQAFKDRVSPREQASFTELPPFVNVASSPYDLHIQTGTGTQVEKGGQPVSITVDYDGTTRNATFPDAGADEFAGTFTDNASPLITYTLLGNSDATSPRSVTGVSITDPSGINITAGTKPRIYYKKSTNANTFVDNTNATDGWKFVEASNAASPFSFNIDYTLVNGGVASGNTIQYFVVAQDLNGTPRIGLNSGAFTTQPASVNLAAANFPLLGTINQYSITAGASLSGTINVGSTETITSLTNAGGAFALINSSALSGNVILNITSDLNSELGTNALNQWSEIGVGGYTVTIVSNNTTLKTIQGITNSNGMVRLDGADRVTIDGRSGGSGQYLRFRNFSTSGPAILMLNDAQNNTVRNCILEGNSTSTAVNTAGVINIGNTTGLFGNDNNTITFNEVRDRSDSVKTPALGIFSGGTTAGLPQYNNNCTISNNNVHDFYLDGGTVVAGIFVSSGTSNFNIDSNSVYMVTTRSISVTGTTVTGIGISHSSTVASNGGYNIRNNYIGGSAPLCAGTPWTFGVASTTPIYGLRAMQVVSGQIPNNIQGNTIANFDLTCNGAVNNFLFAGIATGNGIHNIGTTTGNTVGSGTGNDNIKITLNGASGPAIIRGISMAFFTSTVWGGNIENNTVGSITVTGPVATTAASTCDFISVGASVGYVNDFSVSNNLVGSLTTPNSIRFTYPSGGTNMRAISVFPVKDLTATINNNKIMNITETSTSTGSVFFTMLLNGGAGNLKYVVTNNTIANLASGMTSASTNALNGIYLISGNTANVLSGNTVQNLSLTSTTASNSGVVGMLTQTNNSMGGTISNNKVYGLSNQLTGSFPAIIGMWMLNSADFTLTNNMFTLTNGETTDNFSNINNNVPVRTKDNTIVNVIPGYEVPANYQPSAEREDRKDIPAETPSMLEYLIPATQKTAVVSNNNKSQVTGKTEKENGSELMPFTGSMPVYGFYDQTTAGTKTLNYNSIYVGGSNTGTAFNSYCYYKIGTDNASLRNNLFYNNRTGTGVHYAIANDATTPATGWSSTASNYNVFVTSDSTSIGSWGITSNSISQWRTNSAGDNQSWYAKTTEVSAASLFTNIGTGDLHINSSNVAAWLVSGKGIATTDGTDFDGNSRSTSIAGGVTDIGADEFTATPPSSPNALQSGAPSSGGTTDYTLFGRKICTINWGTGGIYPTSMNIAYNSGVSPVAPNVSTPNRTSNSYWTATPVGTFSGTTYDITWYYGDNETYTITNPSTNILLGKNDNTFWMTYPQGTANLMSEFTPSAYSVKVRGLFRFSSFTLGDASLPAEFPRTPLNNSIVATASPTLVWSKSALATSYRVQLATDSLFNTLIVNDSTVTDTTKLLSGLVNGQNYWWRVNGKISLGNVGGWSQVYKFTCVTVLPPALVNLKVIPGGFYNTGTGRLNMKDTVRAILVDSATCTRVDSSRIVIDSVSFTGQLSFANAPTGNYYLFIFHRNHIPIAARFKQTITRGSTVSYDFTTDSAKTFGFNVIKLAAGVWGMMPGDANRDQFVDGLDQTIWIQQNGLDGFLSADFNGDRFVDGLDQTLWILYNGNSSFLPCNITELDPLALEEFMKKHAIKLIDNQRAYEIIQEAIKNKNINVNGNNSVPNNDVKNPVNNNSSNSKNSNTKQSK